MIQQGKQKLYVPQEHSLKGKIEGLLLTSDYEQAHGAC